MLEMAMVFALISTVVIPFGSDYANVANATRDMAMSLVLGWLIAGAVAVIMYRPLERRLLHHA